jgi:hypothetical protein
MPNSDVGPSYGFLAAAVLLLGLAVVGTCTGEVWARFGLRVYRTEAPTDFWTTIAIYYAFGIFFLFLFLNQ